MGILWLGDRGLADPLVAGGKVASLAALCARHRVPAGFCVIGPDFLGERAQTAIARAYARLSRRAGVLALPVAVRSSAVGEDGPANSFAGQHDTYLNIEGARAVVEAVGRCAGSIESDRARAYRREQGIAAPPQIAILVQELIQADVAGVSFSDPVSGRRDRIIVNAAWGLGESVVSGNVTPDVFTLARPSLAILGSAIADKAVMSVAVEGGSREVAVPHFLRSCASLRPRQVIEVAELAANLETEVGHPVDIEFAFAAGRLNLLQCRPITGLG